MSSACLHVVDKLHSVCGVAISAPCVHSMCSSMWNGCACVCSVGSCVSDCCSVSVLLSLSCVDII